MKDGDGNHSYVDDKLYPLVMTNKKRLKPWPSRNSGFTQLQNGGSFQFVFCMFTRGYHISTNMGLFGITDGKVMDN